MLKNRDQYIAASTTLSNNIIYYNYEPDTLSRLFTTILWNLLGYVYALLFHIIQILFEWFLLKNLFHLVKRTAHRGSISEVFNGAYYHLEDHKFESGQSNIQNFRKLSLN